MRAVILGVEQCGLIHDLASGLRELGHEVKTIANPDPYFAYEYDLSLDSVWHTLHFSANLKCSKLTIPTRFRRSSLYRVFNQKKIKQIIRFADIIIQVWGIVDNQADFLRVARSYGKPYGVVLLGSDVRDYRQFVADYDTGGWEPPEWYTREPTAEKIKRLKLFETLATSIFSVPDQMSFASQPYFRVRVPLNLSRFKPNIPGRSIPKVIHAPTNSGIKGTAGIESALSQLRDEGVQFQYERITNISNRDLMNALSDTDIVLDQMILHGPAWLAMESLASGCAVAARVLTDEFSKSFPIWPICPNTLLSQLRVLLRDCRVRVTLAEAGLKCAQSFDRKSVAQYYLERIIHSKEFASDRIASPGSVACLR